MSDAPESALSQETMQAAKASFDRCCGAPDFFLCFYRNFFKRAPSVEPMFASTDFKRQHQLLKHAIGLLLVFPNQKPDDPPLLKRVAARHSRAELGIDPSLYPAFVDALITTVAEHDSEFDEATERAWRDTVAAGITYMQAAY